MNARKFDLYVATGQFQSIIDFYETNTPREAMRMLLCARQLVENPQATEEDWVNFRKRLGRGHWQEFMSIFLHKCNIDNLKKNELQCKH